ncbi:MAG TPA: hypothetical protein VNZ52_12030 [Candidatus Thermoplasmatota archaeon]|nr:hypothetical protein [Candidatus Thermoplasmatota archaeon]
MAGNRMTDPQPPGPDLLVALLLLLAVLAAVGLLMGFASWRLKRFRGAERQAHAHGLPPKAPAERAP